MKHGNVSKKIYGRYAWKYWMLSQVIEYLQLYLNRRILYISLWFVKHEKAWHWEDQVMAETKQKYLKITILSHTHLHTHKAWSLQTVSFCWRERHVSLKKPVSFNQSSNTKWDECINRFIQVKTYNFQTNFNWGLRSQKLSVSKIIV